MLRLSIREMQLKTTMRFHLIASENGQHVEINKNNC